MPPFHHPRLVIASIFLLCLPAFSQNDNPKKGSGTKGDSDVKVTQPAAKKSQGKGSDQPKDAGKATKKSASKKGKQAAEEEKQPDVLSSGTFAGLKMRSIGPAVIAGRVVSLAVDPNNRAHYFVGTASGGLWKTESDGVSWEPVFDNEGSYSIGTVVLDPNDSNVVWVGTGENNSQRSVAYGDGVYRSQDGGKSWKNMGLKKSEHIARIVIDPRDSNVVYVAAQGPLWGSGGDRGLYKTTDGGATWKAVLTISENTGVSDLVMDPRDPDVLYASSYQRQRKVWTLVDGGPEGAIYKTTDAGKTWNKINSGLPGVDLGRIGLAISPSKPDTIYAVVEAAQGKGGIFRSTNRGASWEKRNPYDETGMYYGTVFVDPRNSERIFVMGVVIQASDDGGKTFHALSERAKHGDNHVIWVDPNDTDYYLVGSDGGVYESYDRGNQWTFKQNLPLAQFYDVAVDNSKPFYYIYGGTQDNSNWGGPSQSLNANGVISTDWFFTQGGDGFRSAVDPEDPDTVYAEYQFGAIIRFNRKTGEKIGVQPVEGKGEPPLRWNWDSPIIISSHDHKRLYFAANKVFRSDDRGDSWKVISPDLSRQIDRDSLPVMGKVWGPDAVAKNASTTFYGNVVDIAESPKNEKLLFAGTDDGLIQITNDGGASWQKVDHFPGVPDRSLVSRVVASPHDERVVFAAFDNHKEEDFKPYLLKSSDGGQTWSSIASNLPDNGTVYAFAQDPVNPQLLFVGTEFGLFFSIDGGGKWIQIKSGMPTISVHDLVIQKREGDLVVATFGRGFYILDDLTPLRQLRAEQLNDEAFVTPVKNAMMYLPREPFGGSRPWFGENFYMAPNAPYGATFTYYLKEKYKSAKEQRQDAEKEAAKKNNGTAYPTLKYPTEQQLVAEAQAEAPSVWLTVADANGNIVRRLPAENNAGYNRTSWDLRYPAVELPAENRSADSDDYGPRGRLVMPGKYSVRLSKKFNGKWSDLGQPQAFQVYALGTDEMPAADLAALNEFQQKLLTLDGAVSGALNQANEMRGRLKKITQALQQTPADTSAAQAQIDNDSKRLEALLITLRGNNILRRLQDPTPPSIADRINNIEDEERLSTQKPTQTHINSYNVAADEFTQALAELKAIQSDVSGVEQQMNKWGSPWTPGRIPEWSSPK